MKVRVLAAEGIGRADFANAHAAVSCHPVNNKWHLAASSVRQIEGYHIGWNSEVARGEGSFGGMGGGMLGPESPRATDVKGTAPHERLRVRLEACAKAIADQTFPIDRGPMPEEEFRAVQARTHMTLPGAKSLYAEATDLVSEHQFSLPRAAGLHEKMLGTSENVRDLADAARRLMRVRKDDPAVLAGLEKALAKAPHNAWANLYKAMWLWEADRDDAPCAKVPGHLQKAARLPGARYLLALVHARRGGLDEAVQLLESLQTMGPGDTFYGPADPALALLQPGAVCANTRPMLLLAVLYQMEKRDRKAAAVLRNLLKADPALIEAWVLLGDAEKVRTLTAANPSGKRDAEATLSALRAGRWRGIGRP
jgi:tetratricopeptide (TPR) repeat protein